MSSMSADAKLRASAAQVSAVSPNVPKAIIPSGTNATAVADRPQATRNTTKPENWLT